MSAPIAYVAGTYPQLSETFVTGELRELRRAGEEPLVFSILRGDGPLDGAPEATYVVELGKARQLASLAALIAASPRSTVRALARAPRSFGGSARDVAALAPIARTLRKAGVGHIHAHFASLPTDVAGRLSALTGIPFSFTAHARDIYVEWERMEAKLAQARFAVTVCEYNRRFILERVPGAAPSMHLVVCGVDPEEFSRKRPYVPDGPIVAVGRLVEQKGFADLVRAAALAAGDVPEVVIAGEGPQRAELEALIERLGAPVRLAGAMGHDRVRELYESASVAVLPCVVAADGARDSMPVSVKEAMALELPVVGTREVGMPEMVDDERGVLVAPGDPEALAGALRTVAAMPTGQRQAMGRAGRVFVAERCNLRTETLRLLELIRSAQR